MPTRRYLSLPIGPPACSPCRAAASGRSPHLLARTSASTRGTSGERAGSGRRAPARVPSAPRLGRAAGRRDPQQTVWVNAVPEPKFVKKRLHLDIHTRSVAELVELGASVLDDTLAWTVMADPDGGEFCAFVREEPPDQRLYELVMDAHDPRASCARAAGTSAGTSSPTQRETSPARSPPERRAARSPTSGDSHHSSLPGAHSPHLSASRRASPPRVAYVRFRIDDGTVTNRTRDSPPAGPPDRTSSRSRRSGGRSWLGIAPPGADARTRART
jgi:hypothetical protein